MCVPIWSKSIGLAQTKWSAANRRTTVSLVKIWWVLFESLEIFLRSMQAAEGNIICIINESKFCGINLAFVPRILCDESLIMIAKRGYDMLHFNYTERNDIYILWFDVVLCMLVRQPVHRTLQMHSAFTWQVPLNNSVRSCIRNVNSWMGVIFVSELLRNIGRYDRFECGEIYLLQIPFEYYWASGLKFPANRFHKIHKQLNQ